MKFYNLIISLLIISTLCLSGCISTESSGETVSIKTAGGTALIPIMKDISKEYMHENRNVQVEVTGGGSGFGIKETGEGRLTIGMAGRDLKSEEKEKYPNMVVYKIGLDGIAIITHKENPVSDLTTKELQKIYSGEITNWNEIGGGNNPINIYTREEESGTHETFLNEGLLKGNISPRSLMVSSNGEMKSKISLDKNGIGYISIGYVDDSVKTLMFNGVEPTQENVKEGIYKIYRPLNILTNGKPENSVQNFIEYILGPNGQKIIENNGFLPVN
ncbi:phosphate binding protein [Methanococcus vannielii SB]|uniref:Phosphate binding protein n=1 Tax=Methanococcus vannielii (strain ATCC 35089 / DSM 1224 / JCM 13029 / OCM 148 / SB) TaxID=406327 RepID=A6URY0_METVS|nr:phosphate ABC transporter substrate-binding protein [Methanococcus vannielii]ABR55252.1 phosphate binding protein [Methanococcus vannielii SB]